ncbi:hypothetical protein Tco_0620100 [Tanacetum coccineum]
MSMGSLTRVSGHRKAEKELTLISEDSNLPFTSHRDSLLRRSGSLQPTVNLELPLIRETMPLLKTTGLLCNKFKGGKDEVMLVLAIRVMLLVLRETIQEDMQGLLNAINNKLRTHATMSTQPKRPRNAVWFKEKAMLAEALESGQILDEEQLAFLANPCILDGQTA